MYYIPIVLILTELFHLEYLNLKSIILRSSDWISINRPPFDSSYREKSNGIYYISIALILTELFRFEFYNKNLTLFTPISTLFRPYFDPRGPGPDHFDPGGLISVSCITTRSLLGRYHDANFQRSARNYAIVPAKI